MIHTPTVSLSHCVFQAAGKFQLDAWLCGPTLTPPWVSPKLYPKLRQQKAGQWSVGGGGDGGAVAACRLNQQTWQVLTGPQRNN